MNQEETEKLNPDNGLFTPYDRKGITGLKPFADDQRVKMRLSDRDKDQIRRGKGWSAVITDLNTGKIFQVKSAKCGANCYCGAKVVREIIV